MDDTRALYTYCLFIQFQAVFVNPYLSLTSLCYKTNINIYENFLFWIFLDIFVLILDTIFICLYSASFIFYYFQICSTNFSLIFFCVIFYVLQNFKQKKDIEHSQNEYICIKILLLKIICV